MRCSLVLIISVLLFGECVFAQPSDLFLNPLENKTKDYGWKTLEEIGLYFNQVSFNNWNAGGANSISAIFDGKVQANYKSEKLFWNSNLSSILLKLTVI